MQEFTGVVLDKSFVLSWHTASEQFSIDVDLQLAETHPKYEKPRPAEKVCIRPAIIEFPYCDAVLIDGRPVSVIAEAAAELRHGSIRGLRRLPDNRYEISGDFGVVTIAAERPLVRIKGR